MTAIRVIFDGKAFVPKQPVSLPKESEGLVIVEETDPAAQARLDAEIRAYYEAGGDAEDQEWAKATSAQPTNASASIRQRVIRRLATGALRASTRTA